MSDELKPCPFCGDREFEVCKEFSFDEAYVRCSNCGAKGPWHKNTKGAREEWNTRAEVEK